MRFEPPSSRSIVSSLRFAPRVVVAAMVLLLAACGQSPSFTLTLDTVTAAVVRGGDVEVEVTLTRAGGASTGVALTITGLPANVTAQFSPASLSGGTLRSTLTISAAAAAVAGSYDVTVTGTGTGLVDSVDLTLDVTSLSVTGRLVTILEVPVVGASIRSQGASAVTGADGAFTLTGLSIPYDVAVWNQADEWVHIVEGLTTADLVVSPVAATTPSPAGKGTTVGGNLTGGVMPVAANQVVVVCAEGTDGMAIGCDTVYPTESAYSVSVQWFTANSRDVRLHALQLQRDANGYPTAYFGYATMDVTLTNAVPTMANLDLGDALSTVTVDVDIVSPVAVSGTFAALQAGPNLAIPITLLNSDSVTHQILMPVIDDTSYTFVSAATTSQFGWQADVTSTTATVSVPAVPQLTSPADLATGVTGSTLFTAATGMDGPKTFVWGVSGGGLSVARTTMSATTTLPDLAPFGLALPAATTFRWQVVGQAGDSVEDGTTAILDSFNFTLMISLSSTGFDGEGAFAVSSLREFTTAP